MSAELTAGEQFLLTRLSSDTAGFPVPTVPPVVPGNTLDLLVPGGFHSERIATAPPGRYCMWSFMGAPDDVTGESGVRIMTQPLMLVRIVDKTSDFSTLQAAADRMDAVLHLAPPTVAIVNGVNYTIRHCVRERAFNSVERFLDVERRHLGGLYRLYIQPF